MGIYYLGTFPPEYGGVTIKNQNLHKALEQYIEIRKVDFNEVKRGNVRELLKLVWVLINPKNQFVVGVAGTKTRRQFCQLLYYVNKRAMSKSVILLMGSAVANDIAQDSAYIRYVKTYRKVYVETFGMQKILENCGLNNVDYYPNGRFRPQTVFGEKQETDAPLSCVFFSLIAPEKGVDMILKTAKTLQSVEFSFYGPIAKEYQEAFFETVHESPNVRYNGVFKGDSESVYRELRKFDLLLLPTMCKTEGVPGILVETKIAGIPAIVSNVAYNGEIVRHGVEGVVMEETTDQCLAACIVQLLDNRSLIRKMGMEAKKSSEKYILENYVSKILEDMGQLR